MADPWRQLQPWQRNFSGKRCPPASLTGDQQERQKEATEVSSGEEKPSPIRTSRLLKNGHSGTYQPWDSRKSRRCSRCRQDQSKFLHPTLGSFKISESYISSSPLHDSSIHYCRLFDYDVDDCLQLCSGYVEEAERGHIEVNVNFPWFIYT